MMEERDIMPEHRKRFDDCHVYPRAYRSILKIFWIRKKTLVIPPLLFENRLHRTNHLISTNQSDFKIGDSCISHVLSSYFENFVCDKYLKYILPILPHFKNYNGQKFQKEVTNAK